MQKQMQLQQLPKLIMAVTLVVMLGALFGAVGYLINYWATAPIHYIKPLNDFCRSVKLEDCDGKRVSIIGLVDYIPKGATGIITDIQDRDAEYKWAGGIFLMKNGRNLYRDEGINKGSIINVTGIIQKGGQPCSPPGRPEQCLDSYHATQIEIESLKVIEEQGIIISTDKTEYGQGETVKITIKNNLDKTIWYIKDACPSSCCDLYKWENNKWENLGDSIPCIFVSLSPQGRPSSIEPDELKIGENTWKLWNMMIRRGLAENGKYRFSFYYGLSKESYTEKTIYSNEFTIREKQSDVSITTNKTEYELGETITAILNHKDKIYQWDKYAWSIQKLEDNARVTIQRRDDSYFFCANTSECKNERSKEIKECLPVVLCEMPMWYEIKDVPKLVWDQSYKVGEKNFSCEIPAHLGEAKRLDDRNCAIFDQVPAGKYKIRFEYAVSINPDDLFSREVDIRYTEKEFTIKEKSAIDPRCRQKVRGIGPCEAARIGYEFDLASGKCIKKTAGGCSFEIPFNSLEECQKVCEKPQVDFYSCAQDSDCIKVKDGCCGCNAGGGNISINKNYEKEWKEKLSKVCRDMACPMVISNDPSCFAEPKCENGKCVLGSKDK